VGAEYCVTSCDLVVFTDKIADPLPGRSGMLVVSCGPPVPGSGFGRALPGSDVGFRSTRDIRQNRWLPKMVSPHATCEYSRTFAPLSGSAVKKSSASTFRSAYAR
jgi:hypothetical protein